MGCQSKHNVLARPFLALVKTDCLLMLLSMPVPHTEVELLFPASIRNGCLGIYENQSRTSIPSGEVDMSGEVYAERTTHLGTRLNQMRERACREEPLQTLLVHGGCSGFLVGEQAYIRELDFPSILLAGAAVLNRDS